jgi:hypothetical protein
MSLRYKSFVENIWSDFPELKKVKFTDITNYNYFWTLKQHIDVGYLNFKTERKYLYRLSILLENYAVQNKAPLLATFETENRYKYVEDRYHELLQKISRAWIIGDFKNPFLPPNPPKSAKVISCDGTNIDNMWIVLTRRSTGPFGLVAENTGKGQYRGFFSISPPVIGEVIKNISKQLKTNFDFSTN